MSTDSASAVSLSHFGRDLQRSALDADLALCHRLADAWSKSDGSLATDADVAVEGELRARLEIERPNDAVLGEEWGQTGTGAGGRRWIIDGIDGTVDFAAGSSEWGTLIALEVDGRVVLSVCDQPAN